MVTVRNWTNGDGINQSTGSTNDFLLVWDNSGSTGHVQPLDTFNIHTLDQYAAQSAGSGAPSPERAQTPTFEQARQFLRGNDELLQYHHPATGRVEYILRRHVATAPCRENYEEQRDLRNDIGRSFPMSENMAEAIDYFWNPQISELHACGVYDPSHPGELRGLITSNLSNPNDLLSHYVALRNIVRAIQKAHDHGTIDDTLVDRRIVTPATALGLAQALSSGEIDQLLTEIEIRLDENRSRLENFLDRPWWRIGLDILGGSSVGAIGFLGTQTLAQGAIGGLGRLELNGWIPRLYRFATRSGDPYEPLQRLDPRQNRFQLTRLRTAIVNELDTTGTRCTTNDPRVERMLNRRVDALTRPLDDHIAQMERRLLNQHPSASEREYHRALRRHIREEAPQLRRLRDDIVRQVESEDGTFEEKTAKIEQRLRQRLGVEDRNDHDDHDNTGGGTSGGTSSTTTRASANLNVEVPAASREMASPHGGVSFSIDDTETLVRSPSHQTIPMGLPGFIPTPSLGSGAAQAFTQATSVLDLAPALGLRLAVVGAH